MIGYINTEWGYFSNANQILTIKQEVWIFNWEKFNWIDNLHYLHYAKIKREKCCTYLLTSGFYTPHYFWPIVFSIKDKDLHAVGDKNRDVQIWQVKISAYNS